MWISQGDRAVLSWNLVAQTGTGDAWGDLEKAKDYFISARHALANVSTQEDNPPSPPVPDPEEIPSM